MPGAVVMGTGVMIGAGIFASTGALTGQFAELAGRSSRVILSGHRLQATIKINLSFQSLEA